MRSTTALVVPRFRSLPALADGAIIIAGSLVIAVLAQVSIPLWPVPITGQTLGVILVAALLGSSRGTAAVALYLTEGAIGLPFFAGGRVGLAVLAGPTGGYLLGFVIAAWIIGTLAERGILRRPLVATVCMVAAHIAIYVPGVTWLAQFVGSERVMAVGLYPFIAGDILKSVVAVGIVTAAGRFAKGRTT